VLFWYIRFWTSQEVLGINFLYFKIWVGF
jgi:hypothetical protein